MRTLIIIFVLFFFSEGNLRSFLKTDLQCNDMYLVVHAYIFATGILQFNQEKNQKKWSQNVSSNLFNFMIRNTIEQ